MKSFIALILLVSSLSVYEVSFATLEYSGRTGQGCLTCHLKAEGGPLKETGLQFAASGYVWPPEGGYKVLGPIRKSVRLAIGYFHVTASFIWFGAILYVHLLLRPAYASKGLPKAEVLLGLFSMTTVGITGVLLTVSRIGSLDILYKSPWGILFSIKIIIYSVMVSSALFVVTFVGPRLKKSIAKGAGFPKDGGFDTYTLLGFNGKEGRPTLVAYKGKVYDMTGLKLWKDGVHMKHHSGEDLTEALKKAPHGEEKLSNLKIVGSYDVCLRPPEPPAKRMFFLIAYMNLALVFAVLFVISFWRWGI